MRSSSPGPSFSTQLDHLGGGRLFDDTHAADAAALDAFDDEPCTAGFDGLARLRESTELGDDKSAERVVVRSGLRRRQVQVERLADVLERNPRVHQRLALRHRQHHLLLDVVLVAYLADDLLDQILDRHEPAGAAVLVDDDRNVDLVLLHVAKELVDLLGLWDELSRSHVRPDLDVLLPAREAPEEILHVEDADDVVRRALVERDTRVADVRDDLEDLVGRRIDVYRDDVRARDHDLVHRLLRDGEDRREHALLALLKYALGLSGLDQRFDLVLGHERQSNLRVYAAEGSGDQPGEVEQESDERSRDPGHELEGPDEHEEHALGVTCANGSRNEYPEEHRDEREDRDGDGDGRDVTNDGRVLAEQELQEVRQARRDVRGRNAGEGEHDEKLRDLNGREIFDRLPAHRACATAAPSARGELFDELWPADRVQGGLARREHGEDRNEHQLEEQELGEGRVH